MTMTAEQADQQAKVYGRIVSRTWTDETFKQHLLADPTTVLKAEGIQAPEGIELRLVEDSDTVMYVALPVEQSDGSFKQRLLTDPAGVLAAHGMRVSEGTEIRIVEDTGAVMYFTLPAKPVQLSDEQLDQVAGGTALNYQYNHQFSFVIAQPEMISAAARHP